MGKGDGYIGLKRERRERKENFEDNKVKKLVGGRRDVSRRYIGLFAQSDAPFYSGHSTKHFSSQTCFQEFFLQKHPLPTRCDILKLCAFH